MSSYSPRVVRTSMSLDAATLELLDELALRSSVSKAEVMRRAVRRLKEEADREDRRPSPIAALEWLQGGGGLKEDEAAVFRSEVREEREAKRHWWEA